MKKRVVVVFLIERSSSTALLIEKREIRFCLPKTVSLNLNSLPILLLVVVEISGRAPSFLSLALDKLKDHPESGEAPCL